MIIVMKADHGLDAAEADPAICELRSPRTRSDRMRAPERRRERGRRAAPERARSARAVEERQSHTVVAG